MYQTTNFKHNSMVPEDSFVFFFWPSPTCRHLKCNDE